VLVVREAFDERRPRRRAHDDLGGEGVARHRHEPQQRLLRIKHAARVMKKATAAAFLTSSILDAGQDPRRRRRPRVHSHAAHRRDAGCRPLSASPTDERASLCAFLASDEAHFINEDVVFDRRRLHGAVSGPADRLNL